MFWTDTSSDRIYRAHLDGSNAVILVTSGQIFAGTMLNVNPKAYAFLIKQGGV